MNLLASAFQQQQQVRAEQELAFLRAKLSATKSDRQVRIDDATEALRRLCGEDFVAVVLSAAEARPDLTDKDLERMSNILGRMPHQRKWRA